MNMHKIKDFKKSAVIVSLLLVILFVAIRVIPFVGTTETKDYDNPIEVREGISVVSGLENEVGEEELSELIEEYGTDANIIIYDIGY